MPRSPSVARSSKSRSSQKSSHGRHAASNQRVARHLNPHREFSGVAPRHSAKTASRVRPKSWCSSPRRWRPGILGRGLHQQPTPTSFSKPPNRRRPASHPSVSPRRIYWRWSTGSRSERDRHFHFLEMATRGGVASEPQSLQRRQVRAQVGPEQLVGRVLYSNHGRRSE